LIRIGACLALLRVRIRRINATVAKGREHSIRGTRDQIEVGAIMRLAQVVGELLKGEGMKIPMVNKTLIIKRYTDKGIALSICKPEREAGRKNGIGNRLL
jgi:hypothetical protein